MKILIDEMDDGWDEKLKELGSLRERVIAVLHQE